MGEEDWQALAGALRAKGKLVVDVVVISRKFLTDVGESIKDIWDATRDSFVVADNTDEQHVESQLEKSEYDVEGAWTRLKHIADMAEDEFAADCKLLWWGEGYSDSDEDEEEESGEEDHDGEEGDDEEEDHDGEHEGDDEDS